MFNNHIIIGLGGTGGKVILAFRKILWEECRNLEARFKNEQTDAMSDPVANIAYLYADSNQDDLDGTNGNWELLGQSLKLDDSEKVLLSDESGGSALINKKQFPSVSGWIGDTEILKPLARDSRTLKGCNQIRRFGRYVFAQNAGTFMEKVRASEAKLLRASNKDGRTFHICCTLGCGTGSGSIVDAVSQIRKEHPDEKANPIFLYCLVNSEIGEKCNVGYFYQNQFAVLSELNAMSLTLWHPHDVLPKTNDEPRLEDVKDQFEACYLVSPKTQDRQYADKAAQEEMIAAFLYQKIVPLRDNLPEMLQKAESAEDFKANRNPERCSRFSSLGIKRYRIPEKEIREKLTFTFCRQAALQILNNNLTQAGYTENERPFDAREWASKPENLERWCLTDAHLMLSTDFRIAGGTVWPSIVDDWTGALRKRMEFLIKFKNKVREDRQTWLTEMIGFSDLYYSRNFRDAGVNSFYESKREALPEYARAIRRKVETQLFEQWRLGEHALKDSDKILEVIIAKLNERKEGFDKRVTESRKAAESATGRIRQAETNWQKIGWLTEVFFTKAEKVLGAYTSGLTDKHVAHTEAVACDFAKELVQQIIDQLEECRRRLAEEMEMFANHQKSYQEMIDKRIADNPETDLKKVRELRLVNRDQIDKTISALRAEATIQKQQCAEVRDRITASLGADPEERTFTNFVQKITPKALHDLIYKTCDGSVDIHHTNFFNKQRDVKKILGRNIVDKLYEETQGDISKLTSQIDSLVKSANAYMQINTSEKVETGSVQMPQQRLVIFIPQTSGDGKFRQELAKAFEACYNRGQGADLVIAENKNNIKEILLISVWFFYELRFIQPMVYLREQYENFVKKDPVKAVHLIHMENHCNPIKGLKRPEGIKWLPSLYPEETTDEDYVRYVLLGIALGWVVSEENADGVNVLQYARRNVKGRPLGELIDLGHLDPLEAAKQLPRASFMKIKPEIDSELKQSYRRPERKEALKAKFGELLDTKFEECNRKAADPVFQTFQKAVDAISESLNNIDQ